jgi:eukaryotic-like serine/threonine-protein kinase
VLETQAGTVLGTVGYMAPEQVRGERADARSDLFSLGVVLHELLSGANPFRRDSTIESLNAILKEEPADLAATPSGANPALARVVARLLGEGPGSTLPLRARSRLRARRVAAMETERQHVGATAVARRRPCPPLAPRRRSGLALLAAGLVGGTLVSPSPRPAARLVQFEVAPPAEGGFPSNAEVHNLALSPDGRTLAYVTTHDGQSSSCASWRASRSAPAGRHGRGASPFWSPDGAALAFFAGGKLKRVARDGGPVQTICDVQGTTTGAWGSGGAIVYSQGFGPTTTGCSASPPAAARPSEIALERDLPRWIEFLPDGRALPLLEPRARRAHRRHAVFDLATGRTTRRSPASSRRRATPRPAGCSTCAARRWSRIASTPRPPSCVASRSPSPQECRTSSTAGARSPSAARRRSPTR